MTGGLMTGRCNVRQPPRFNMDAEEIV